MQFAERMGEGGVSFQVFDRGWFIFQDLLEFACNSVHVCCYQEVTNMLQFPLPEWFPHKISPFEKNKGITLYRTLYVMRSIE